MSLFSEITQIYLHIGGYLTKVREELPFANGASVSKMVNDAFLELLGPKTEEDEKRREERKKAEAGKFKQEPINTNAF